MKFIEKLQTLMYRHDLTQQKLADRVGIPRPTIGLWLSGHSKPRDRALRKLADFFGVSLDDLKNEAKELPEKAFIAHVQTLKRGGELGKKLFPEDERKAVDIADTYFAAEYAMKAIPALENRLEKMEELVSNLLKPNTSKVSRVTLLDESHANSDIDARLSKVESGMERMASALEKLTAIVDAGNRPATLEQIERARKLADKMSAELAARNHKKKAK